MMRTKLRSWMLPIAAAALVVFTAAGTAHASLLMRVLVTNDDGVEAEGLSVLVSHLAAIRGLQVEVLAPATNQSGTGDNFSTMPIEVFSARTAAGFPARAVRGFPADAVLFGVLSGTTPRPDLVVSGINFGQNIGEAVDISGTVGAAVTAARLGIPGFAVSQGLAQPISYEEAAAYTAGLVARFRGSATFRRLMGSSRVPGRARVLNINFPSCTTGSVRGVRTVLIGRSTKVVGYDPAPEPDVWVPLLERTPLGSNDCNSTLKRPLTDLEAMNNGFAAVTMLNTDLANENGTGAVKRYVED
jgi:5'/3'-nucleotidase